MSVALMAHPARSRWVDGIVRRVDADVQVVWDEGWNDRHQTGLAAIRAADPAADYHLILQDDIVVCDDLVAGTKNALEYVPDGHPLSLFTGRARPHRTKVAGLYESARLTGAAFMSFPGPWWGQGVVLPTGVIDELASWFERHVEIENYDRRMSRWFERQGLRCFYTVPCLVDHREQAENPSLVIKANGQRRTGSNRTAVEFIGRGRSALEVDWSAGVATLGRRTMFTHTSGQRRVGRVGSDQYNRLVRLKGWSADGD